MPESEEVVIPRYCESHFDWAKGELKKEESRHHKAKEEIIIGLGERLERSKRVPVHKICGLISSVLDKEGYASARYVRMVFSDPKHNKKYTKYMELSKTTKASKDSKREDQEALPHIETAPQVISVSEGGKTTTEPEPVHTTPIQKAPESDVVKELKKKLSEANQIIQVQKDTIDNISRARTSSPEVSGRSSVRVHSEPQMPEVKLSSEESKLKKRITELEEKLTPYEQNKMLTFRDKEIPVIAFVNPQSRNLELRVDEKLAKRMFG